MLVLQQYTLSLLLNLPSMHWWTIITPSMNKMLEMAKHVNDGQVKKDGCFIEYILTKNISHCSKQNKIDYNAWCRSPEPAFEIQVKYCCISKHQNKI